MLGPGLLLFLPHAADLPTDTGRHRLPQFIQTGWADEPTWTRLPFTWSGGKLLAPNTLREVPLAYGAPASCTGLNPGLDLGLIKIA